VRAFLFLPLLFGLAVPMAALAQEPPQTIRLENLSSNDILAIAGKLIDAGRYDDALTLLRRLGADNAGGVERDFLEAMAELVRKDYPRAEALFRNILERDPSLIRVRLELARTLYLEKKDEDAEYHFKLAIAEHPPQAVIANIARFREALRARRAWRFNINFAIAPDSNINSATEKERVDILGLPFKLDRSARAQSGTGWIAGGDANIRLRRDSELPIYLAGYGHVVRYGSRRFDDLYVGGEVGPEFRMLGGRLRIAAIGQKRWYDGQALVTSLGVRPHFDKIIGGKLNIDTSLAVRHNDYSRRADIDGWDIEAALAANRALGATALGFVYGLIRRGISKDDGYSNWQGRSGIGVQKEIRWGLRPQLALEVGGQINDSPLGLYGKTRQDWHLQVTASIYKRDWNVAGFAPSVGVTWSRSNSTISLYDQKRLRVEFGIAKAF
jgi:thioredoxin-like negative regulator of GroEL